MAAFWSSSGRNDFTAKARRRKTRVRHLGDVQTRVFRLRGDTFSISSSATESAPCGFPDRSECGQCFSCGLASLTETPQSQTQ